MNLRSTLAAAVALVPLAAGPTFAQAPVTPADARWAPWLGCWRSVDDLASVGARVCVVPRDAGVAVVTVVGGQRISDELRIADGRDRTVDTAGCRGTAVVRWAEHGARLYRTAKVACDGADARTLTSVSFFGQGPTWVDVETVKDGDDTRVRVTRLVRASTLVLADGTTFARSTSVPTTALAKWTVDDVIDMSRMLPPDGVQAAVAEVPGPFALNKRSLAALADAGVADRVIDLMVGVTYPSKFVVQRATAGPSPIGPIGVSLSDPFFSPIVGPAALFNCYQPFSWAEMTYWSDCAGYDSRYYARAAGYYSGYWGVYGPDWIPTTVVGAIGGLEPAAAPLEGRLVNGRGYTQVRPVDTTYGASNSGAATSGGTSTGQSSGGSNGGSNGGSVSGGGYSGGGASAGGGERTAVPRGPGGGA